MVRWYALYVVYINIYIHGTMVRRYMLYIYINIYIHGTRYEVRRYMLYISTYISMVRCMTLYVVYINIYIHGTMVRAVCCIYQHIYPWYDGMRYDAICCIYQHIYPWYDGTSTAHNNSINITIPAEKLLSFHNLYF